MLSMCYCQLICVLSPWGVATASTHAYSAQKLLLSIKALHQHLSLCMMRLLFGVYSRVLQAFTCMHIVQ
jgi:hypothetical protein